MHIDKTQRHKFDNKSREVILVGYALQQKAYRVWECGTNRVHISRDVVIVESPPKVMLSLTDSGKQVEKSVCEKQIKCEDNVTSRFEERDAPPNDAIASRTRSKTAAPLKELSGEAYFVEGTPETFEEAVASPEVKQWQEAMTDEMTSLKKNSVWELTELPHNQRAINNKWVFRIKMKPNGLVDKYKARLVVKGCAQKRGIDYEDTFAPVARFESIRILLSVAVAKNFQIRQFDIKAAFLYGDLDEVIFMRQPEGFDDGTGRVCRLRKSLYGLKQAPRQWHQKFDGVLQTFGMTPSSYDPCVYANAEGSLLLALYVDDGMVAGKVETDVVNMLNRLKQEFETIDSSANCYLGIEIERSENSKTIRMHQSAYIRNVLQKFGMDESHPVPTPSDANVVLRYNKDEDGRSKEAADVPYRQVIGSLMYLAVGTRPDIAFAVSNLSQFLANPSVEHWNAAKRVLRYLRGTTELGLVFSGECREPNVLVAYSDADFATCIDTRKSMSGVVLLLNGGPIIWSARKQSVVATSTTEAEYIAAHDASKEVVWTRGLLQEMGVGQELPTILHCDNAAAEKLITNAVFHRRTKHIEVKFHYVRGVYENGQIGIQQIASTDQLADIFTKPLTREKFLANRQGLGIE